MNRQMLEHFEITNGEHDQVRNLCIILPFLRTKIKQYSFSLLYFSAIELCQLLQSKYDNPYHFFVVSFLLTAGNR